VDALTGSSLDTTFAGLRATLFGLMDAKATDAVLAVIRIYAPAVGKEILDNAGRQPITGRVVNR
jgi:hypothetical protein